ncbi:hypothetical protein VST7929_02972 [Vibrio stylophorae]|uniref:Zinc-binding domain-containing protein n=1 Tax=Vibrio stylophorae TaxID=659351 RepID=A0ABM8ZXF0_9VIBR|nr:hypothetical protein [Vibrio stylophorae]CAH0535399.1 hypothetical protein VST7929_02972 [Vibrio stylophorae]
MKVRLNKDSYSEESKRSIGHEFLGSEYKDIEYVCICGKRDVFKAEEQKEDYEVRKEYMWARRVLCRSCWRECRKLKFELTEMEKWYSENKNVALQSPEFLKSWLKALQRYPGFGKKADTARIEFLKKALKNT